MRYLAHFAPDKDLPCFIGELKSELQKEYAHTSPEFRHDYPWHEIKAHADKLTLEDLDRLLSRPGGYIHGYNVRIRHYDVLACFEEDAWELLEAVAQEVQKSRLAVDLRKLGKLLGATEKQIAHAIQKQIRLVSEFRTLIAEANTESQEVTSHY